MDLHFENTSNPLKKLFQIRSQRTYLQKMQFVPNIQTKRLISHVLVIQLSKISLILDL